MREVSNELKTFLFSKQGYVFADLYTFTLAGGNVRRWTSASVPIVCNGLTYNTGPTIRDGGTKQAVGLQVDSVELTISADSTTEMNGISLIKFIQMRGLDGSLVMIERCYAATWEDMMSSGPVGGSVIRHKGRLTDVKSTGAQAIVTVSSWLELLDVDMPADVYQASCGNTLFDAKCGLDRASYAATGLIDGASSLVVLDTNLSAESNTYSLGSLVFNGGPNAGLRRTVKIQTAGLIQLAAPLIATPSPGESFTIWPGCNLTKSICATKFNNLNRFRGQPFVPVPETAI